MNRIKAAIALNHSRRQKRFASITPSTPLSCYVNGGRWHAQPEYRSRTGVRWMNGPVSPAPRVLYIEDRFDNRLLVKRVLMAEGMEVLEADNARDGIHLAKAHVPDLILMDISMPGLDGYEATTTLRQCPELARVPIVALTANVMKGDREKSLEAGCDGYIPKPIDIDRFPGEIRNYIKKGRS
jgi:two-component system cell cycle response regulator DivK